MDPEEHEAIVKKMKKQLYKNNCNYLCRHPEIRAVVRVVLNGIMSDRPENIYDFTANMFACSNLTNVTAEINKVIPRITTLSYEKGFTDYDQEMFFSDGSQCTDAETILKYSGYGREDDEPNVEDLDWKIGSTEFTDM